MPDMTLYLAHITYLRILREKSTGKICLVWEREDGVTGSPRGLWLYLYGSWELLLEDVEQVNLLAEGHA